MEFRAKKYKQRIDLLEVPLGEVFPSFGYRSSSARMVRKQGAHVHSALLNLKATIQRS